MQLSEWNIFCHGWQNWRQNPPGMKPISTSPIRQSGQGFWKEVSVRPKMDRKEGWNELDSEKAKIKREIGIWRYNDYSESFSVLITQSSRFRNWKKTKTEEFRKWFPKKENNWEWNFLTGKLLTKNYKLIIN